VPAGVSREHRKRGLNVIARFVYITI